MVTRIPDFLGFLPRHTLVVANRPHVEVDGFYRYGDRASMFVLNTAYSEGLSDRCSLKRLLVGIDAPIHRAKLRRRKERVRIAIASSEIRSQRVAIERGYALRGGEWVLNAPREELEWELDALGELSIGVSQRDAELLGVRSQELAWAPEAFLLDDHGKRAIDRVEQYYLKDQIRYWLQRMQGPTVRLVPNGKLELEPLDGEELRRGVAAMTFEPIEHEPPTLDLVLPSDDWFSWLLQRLILEVMAEDTFGKGVGWYLADGSDWAEERLQAWLY